MGKPEVQDELSRRRERGRRSQAAFRKRQAQSAQALGIQNRRLKEGIQAAIDAAHGDERPEMLRILRDLAMAAELDIPETISQERVRDGNAGSMAEIASFNTTRIVAKVSDDMPWSVDSPPSAQYRLDCSMWLDPLHYMRISLPPQDILPYLGSGAESFAGLLFWSVMEHSQSACAQHKSEASAKTGLGHSKATQSIKPSFVQTMAKARLEYKETGSISQEHGAAAEDDLGLVLCNLIEVDYRSRGKDPDLWLSCVAIQHRIRKAVGDSTLTTLRTAANKQGDPVLQELLEDVKCSLYDSAVCFGDGPRWNVDVVDSLFAASIEYALATKSL
ncbi:hypothetical protein FSARC_13580 [Fusarium sarcochroum]|uniref:BZIP domain-containing protein n=1 Tax=Fusarium sarcochroum TaxID=1208366 RepID=A0A8H4WSY9_9HYPO|nr:hypothetical protein FSARC_13580 [Fusarium sarcochroum]